MYITPHIFKPFRSKYMVPLPLPLNNWHLFYSTPLTHAGHAWYPINWRKGRPFKRKVQSSTVKNYFSRGFIRKIALPNLYYVGDETISYDYLIYNGILYEVIVLLCIYLSLKTLKRTDIWNVRLNRNSILAPESGKSCCICVYHPSLDTLTESHYKPVKFDKGFGHVLAIRVSYTGEMFRCLDYLYCPSMPPTRLSVVTLWQFYKNCIYNNCKSTNNLYLLLYCKHSTIPFYF